MKRAAFGHSFNGGDVAVFGIEPEKEARQNRLPVDQDRTRAALAEFASMLGARQAEVLAQDLQQGFVRRESDVGLLAVESKSDKSFVARRSSHSLVFGLA